MTKSAPRKVAARKARECNPRRTAKARGKNHQTPQKVAASCAIMLPPRRSASSHRMIDAQFEPFRGLKFQTHFASLQNGM